MSIQLLQQSSKQKPQLYTHPLKNDFKGDIRSRQYNIISCQTIQRPQRRCSRTKKNSRIIWDQTDLRQLVQNTTCTSMARPTGSTAVKTLHRIEPYSTKTKIIIALGKNDLRLVTGLTELPSQQTQLSDYYIRQCRRINAFGEIY